MSQFLLVRVCHEVIMSPWKKKLSFRLAWHFDSHCFGSGFAWICLILGPGHKKKEISRNFIFWSAGCSLLRAEGFYCSLDDVYEGLEIRKLHFLIKKLPDLVFSAVNFFHCLVIKILDLDPDPNPDPPRIRNTVENYWESSLCKYQSVSQESGHRYALEVRIRFVES